MKIIKSKITKNDSVKTLFRGTPLYKRPHTKIAQFLKPRYKCHIFTHGKTTKYPNFAMGSRQDNHDINTPTSQIN